MKHSVETKRALSLFPKCRRAFVDCYNHQLCVCNSHEARLWNSWVSWLERVMNIWGCKIYDTTNKNRKHTIMTFVVIISYMYITFLSFNISHLRARLALATSTCHSISHTSASCATTGILIKNPTRCSATLSVRPSTHDVMHLSLIVHSG